MKSIFSTRRNKSPHQNGEAEKSGTPFFSKESRTPFFNTANGGTLQTKLTVGQPGDKYEKEADNMADAVVNHSTSKPAIQNKEISSIQRVSLATPQEDEKLGTAEQRMEADKLVQEKPEIQKMVREEEEETFQPKSNGSTASSSSGLNQQIKSKSGKGRSLPKNTRAEMEASFGRDFSGVNIHTDQDAVKMNKELGAQAFTYGDTIYFSQGKYNPTTHEGKYLLAHELTHTIQQKGMSENKAQKADDGWRYTLPKEVKRSIAEIQGIVGTTPDGVYGSITKGAVIEYQKILKGQSLYADTIDGKWGKNTDAAHNLFAVAPNAKRKGYNCSGFAFKKFTWIDMTVTKAIYSSMKELKTCSESCSPFDYKFWYWEMDVQGVDDWKGVITNKFRDFHTVGGQTYKDSGDPKNVMSKNGRRPVEGPNPPMFWKPKSGPGKDDDGIPNPRYRMIFSNMEEHCFCSNKLP